MLQATKDTKESNEYHDIKKAIKQDHKAQNTQSSRGMPQNKSKYMNKG